MRLLAALAVSTALVSPALAQRQPASVTSIPSVFPQTFSLLDASGHYVPWGMVDTNTHVFSLSDTGLGNDPNCQHGNIALAKNQLTLINNYLAALPQGSTVQFPRGITFCAWPTLQIAKQVAIDMNGSVWINSTPSGSPFAPMIDFLPTAAVAGSSIRNGTLDGRADVGNYTDSTYFGANPWGGVMLSEQADGVLIENMVGMNSFDNCFGVSHMVTTGAPIGWVPSPNSPQRWGLHHIRTIGCGQGVHSASQGGPGMIGAGVDNGSGGDGVIDDAVDLMSYESFINDVGAGAQAVWSNLISMYAKSDPVFLAAKASTQYPDGIEPAVYIGAVANVSNLQVISPSNVGIWLDWGGRQSTMTGVYVKGSGTGGSHSIIMKGPASWSGLSVQDAAAGKDAVMIDSNAGNWTGFSITGFGITNPVSTPAYTFAFQGPNTVNGIIQTGPMVGTNAAWQAVNKPPGLHFLTVSANGVGIDQPVPGYPFDIAGEIRAYAKAGTAQEAFRFVDTTTNNFLVGKTETAAGVFQLCYEVGPLCNTVQVAGLFALQSYPIASLPACVVGGSKAFVNNGVAGYTPGALVGSTTGSSYNPVYCDNALAWRYGG